MSFKILGPLLLAGLVVSGGVAWLTEQNLSRTLGEQMVGRAQMLATAVNCGTGTLSDPVERVRFINALGGQPDIRLIVVAGGKPLRVIT